MAPLEGFYGVAMREVRGDPVREDFTPLLVRERCVEEWVPSIVGGIGIPKEERRRV